MVEPAVTPFAPKVALNQVNDLFDFWLMWHVYGGFEGLVERAGMQLSTVWRTVKRFRLAFIQHPDEFRVPSIDLDVDPHWKWIASENANSMCEKN